MNTLARSLLLAALCVACGDSDPAAPPDAAPTGPDAATPDAPPAAAMCAPAPGEPCASPAAAPTGAAAVADQVRGEGIPLRCSHDGAAASWDLDPLLQLYGDAKVFMMGEVHGTNEIGAVSAHIFDALVERGLVNVVAMELPMDFDASFQRYVSTGSDDQAEELMAQFAPQFFGTVLPGKARQLTSEARPLRIGCIDSPYGTDLAVQALRDLAEGLTDHRALVLDTLPAPLTWQDTPSSEDIAAASAYYDLIMGNEAAICAELDAAGCDRLHAMATAVWVPVNLWSPTVDMDLWFARREEIIYYNLKSELSDPGDRMYLHMGAFHTNKHEASAGSRLVHEFPATQDHVFSVAAAYGEGSKIWYGQELTLDAYPPVIAEALADGPGDPVFVSTWRPSAACVANPLSGLSEEVSGGTMAQTYDGYLHIRRLTPETRPDDATLQKRRFGPYARFWQIRDRITRLEGLRGN